MKRVASYLLMGMGLITVLGALSLWTTPRLLAQVRAAIVKNVDEPGRTPYQATLTCHTGNSTICFATAAPIPANTRLVLRHVGAEFDIAATKQIVQALITGATNGGAILTPRLMANNSTQDVWTSNEEVLAYYEAGESPGFQVAGGPADNRAILSGYLVDLTK